MASVFKAAVEQELHNQSTVFRRKDTLLAVASVIVQLGQIATTMAVGAPEWVTLTVAAVVGAATALIHANTKGAVTPSMVNRLEQAGMEVFMERESLSEQPTTAAVGQAVELPIYDDDSTSDDYIGEHRVED